MAYVGDLLVRLTMKICGTRKEIDSISQEFI